MIVTICQLHDHGEALEQDWGRLTAHVRDEGSDLVLLPEMPFSSQFVSSPRFDPDRWNAAVGAHDLWEKRLADLQPAVVLGTRPIDFGNERYNEGFIWSVEDGLRAVHAQTKPQREQGSWEGCWIHGAPADFVPVSAAGALIGFLIGAELWDRQIVRGYRHDGVDVLVAPRIAATRGLKRWLAAARRTAVEAAAFNLSSGRADQTEPSMGCGWIITPAGRILAMTGTDRPFVSIPLDLSASATPDRTH
jgi:N-carbamoylputrescine amidase